MLKRSNASDQRAASGEFDMRLRQWHVGMDVRSGLQSQVERDEGYYGMNERDERDE